MPMRQGLASHLGSSFTGLRASGFIAVVACLSSCHSGSMHAGAADARIADAAPDRDARSVDDWLAAGDLPGGLSFLPIPLAGNFGPVWAVALGDVNLDGKLDMMLGQVEHNPESIGTFLGRGDGSFQMPLYQNLEVGAQPLALVIGDFNGDGKPDYAAADPTDGVDVVLGQGDGTFGPLRQVGTPEGFDLAGGDVNGDGKLDLVMAAGSFTGHGFVGVLSVLLGRGDGTFALSTSVAGALSMGNVALADLNGDGRLDIAAPMEDGDSGAANGVAVLLGKGDGTFSAAPTLALPSASEAIAVADLNGDGKPDIVAGTYGTVQVFLGRGDGTFNVPASFAVMTISETGFLGAKVAVADLNGDGRPDLALPSTSGIGVLLGDGTGAFSTPHYFSMKTLPNPVAMAIGDLNGDGRPDIAVSGGGFVSVYLNESQ